MPVSERTVRGRKCKAEHKLISLSRKEGILHVMAWSRPFSTENDIIPSGDRGVLHRPRHRPEIEPYCYINIQIDVEDVLTLLIIERFGQPTVYGSQEKFCSPHHPWSAFIPRQRPVRPRVSAFCGIYCPTSKIGPKYCAHALKRLVWPSG